MALDATEIASIGTGALGVLQTGISLLEKGAARRRQNKLFKQRKNYLIPQEVYDILNATESRAQQGYDPATLQYLTGQADRAFGSALGTAERLGGDPNNLSALQDQFNQSIFKIGAENHALNTENFGKYLGGLDALQQQKTAQFIFEDNKKRDQLAAAGVQFQNANTGVQSGLNTILASGAAFAQDQLYKDKKKKDAIAAAMGSYIGPGDYGNMTPEQRMNLI